MSFEGTVKKLSAILAACVVFFIAASMYLSAKGFVMSPDGSVSLVGDAKAKAAAKPASAAAPGADLPQNAILGQAKAKITVYEFSSLGCSHCAAFHLETLPLLKKEFIDSGKVKIIFADFPLDKKSLKASQLARCMPKDKYYDFLALLFKKQDEWSMSSDTDKLLADYASLSGISAKKAAECLADEKTLAEIMDIRALGMEKLGIRGTPSFLIVKGDKREMLGGALAYEEFKKILDGLTTK